LRDTELKSNVLSPASAETPHKPFQFFWRGFFLPGGQIGAGINFSNHILSEQWSYRSVLLSGLTGCLRRTTAIGRSLAG
jgi:hypothetical protein